MHTTRPDYERAAALLPRYGAAALARRLGVSRATLCRQLPKPPPRGKRARIVAALHRDASLAGLPLREIGARYGASETTAHDAVNEYLHTTTAARRAA